jgi:hypothetical protein
MGSAPFCHSEACVSYDWRRRNTPIHLSSSPTGGDLVPLSRAVSVSFMRSMIESIQIPMHMSKDGGFQVRALRYMTVHDMFSQYALD